MRQSFMIERDSVTPKKLFKNVREVSPFDWTAIAMLMFAALVPIAIAIYWGHPGSIGDLATIVFLGLFVFAVIATFSIIVLWGLGRLALPDKFMSWLGAATIGEIAGLLAFVIHHLFGKQ